MLASGLYRLRDDARWSLGLRGFGSILANTDSGVSDFDTLPLRAGLFADRRFALLQKPASATLSYDFRQDLVDFDDFERRHTVTLGVTNRRRAGTQVGTFYRLAIANFDADFGSTGPSNRDAVRNTLGVSGLYALNRGRETLRGSYAFSANSSRGVNFDCFAHSLSARASAAIVLPLFVSLDLFYSHQSCPDFLGNPRRKMDIVTPQLALDLALGGHFAADVLLAYTRYASNRPEFDSGVLRTGLGVSYRF